MSIERLLQATMKAGGQELRLIPGRRMVIVTPAGEREVQGPEQTPVMIDQLLAPLMTPDSRQALAAGKAEWRFQLAGIGAVRARAEVRQGATHVGFAVGETAAPPAAVAAGRVAALDGTTAAMEDLLRTLVGMKGSDLHISAGSPPMVRHDGEIRTLADRGVLGAADTEKLLWPIAPERNREEFKRRHDTDFAYEIRGLARFRCNFFLDRKGMGGVFRQIPSKIISAEDMGLPKEILQLCYLPKGLVLITGPTGSGKSTTLCALIDYINRNRTDHIITIEDPIEFVHENKKCLITQRQVHVHTESFKTALRAALREDPDIVLVGEMRDLETIAIAIETAETGHLVFGTLHTTTASSTVDRIIDQFPADRQAQIRVMLSESLKGVISQTLCKKTSGGRVAAREILLSTPAIANLIREGKTFQIPSIIQTSKKLGMNTLNDALLELVEKKLIDPDEAFMKSVEKAGLLASLKAKGFKVTLSPES